MLKRIIFILLLLLIYSLISLEIKTGKKIKLKNLAKKIIPNRKNTRRIIPNRKNIISYYFRSDVLETRISESV
jgi:hypothetical protein